MTKIQLCEGILWQHYSKAPKLSQVSKQQKVMALSTAPLPFLHPVYIFLSPFVTSTAQILIESYLQVRHMKISQNFTQMLLMAQWLLNTFTS